MLCFCWSKNGYGGECFFYVKLDVGFCFCGVNVYVCVHLCLCICVSLFVSVSVCVFIVYPSVNTVDRALRYLKASIDTILAIF